MGMHCLPLITIRDLRDAFHNDCAAATIPGMADAKFTSKVLQPFEIEYFRINPESDYVPETFARIFG